MTLNIKPKTIIYIILLAFAIIGNSMPFSLFFGVDFLWGSILLLVIADLFGWTLGLLAALIVGGYTFWHDGYLYGSIIIVLEYSFVKYLIDRKNWKLVMSDFPFWFLLGMPCAALYFTFILQMDLLHSMVLVLKYAVNGIWNALIASLLSTYLPLNKWFPKQEKTLSISRLLFHLMMISVILLSFTIIKMEGKNAIEDQQDQIKEVMDNQANMVTQAIEGWCWKNQTPIRRLADAAIENWNNPAQLQRDTEIILRSFPDFYNMTILDQTGKVLSYYDIFKDKSSIRMAESLDYELLLKQSKTTTHPFVVTDVFWGMGGKFPVIALNHPITKEGQFLGTSIGTLNPSTLKQILSKNINSSEIFFTLIDSQNQVITSNNPSLVTKQIFDWKKGGDVQKVKNDMYQWKPHIGDTELQRWMKSVYTMELPINQLIDWKIVVQVPLNTYQNNIYLDYIRLLLLCLVSALFVLIFSLLIRRLISIPLIELAKQTNDLPGKISSNETFEWPESRFSEFKLLLSNFRGMGSTLHEMFLRLKEANDKLDHLAYYDPLTGLPNRLHFQLELGARIKRAQSMNTAISLMFLDLDRFKLINDTLGHSEGDKLLRFVAERLSSVVCPECFAARLGGDEFVILLNNADKDIIAAKAQKMIQALSIPYFVHEQELIVTPSIGISIYPEDAVDSDMLIKHADTAMYSVKESGKNSYRFFQSSMDDEVKRKMELERKLRKALSMQQLEVHYQPKVNVRSGEIVGVEALCRWHDPDEGWISPAEFIPLAEEIGLIGSLGEWVLEKACRQTKDWEEKGLYTSVSVNLSVRQLKDANLVSLVSSVLNKNKLDPSYLELEITESLNLHEVEEVLLQLHQIKKLGVKISIDDFGTGYSSLSYFRNYPIDIIKIDQSFVQNYHKDMPIIEAILDIANRLGLEVIAEGIETGEQLDFLIGRGCHLMQGYYFSPPVTHIEIENLLKSCRTLFA